MNERQQITEWTKQRYEYYVAGRTLWFCNRMQTGALMLAYSIEAHIKHILSRQEKCPQKLLYSHDIPKLFSKSKELGLFSDVEVSDDLLRYVQDNFHRRYPSQTREIMKNAMSIGHCLGMHVGLIPAYDDLVLQLDQSLYRTLHNVRASIATMGAQQVNGLDGRFFFHSNYVAIDLLEDIKKMHEEALMLLLKEEHESIHELNKHAYQERLAILSDKDKLLVANNGLTRVFPGHNKNIFRSYAKSFSYPGRYYKMEDGTRVVTIG